MRIAVHHETRYSYSAKVFSTVQLLRLTPRPEPQQRVIEWHIEAPGKLQQQLDAYGNITHLLTLHQPHDELVVTVKGIVELSPIANGVLGESDAGISPLAFGLSTPLSSPDPAIDEFVRRTLPRGLRNSTDALLLASSIADEVNYIPGATEVSSTAVEAFALRKGVCQDHAHVFLACCRSLNVPARYVSGYVHPGTAEYAASHAWVDVWIAGSGWVSIDVTNRQLISDRHCRLAIARDYSSAAPIRGVRIGGGHETMRIQVEFGPNQ